jgi:6-phosphogluconolactonase
MVRDEGLSANSQFLYAVDADSRQVFGWAVGDSGSLSPIGSWNGLPETVAGLAAT